MAPRRRTVLASLFATVSGCSLPDGASSSASPADSPNTDRSGTERSDADRPGIGTTESSAAGRASAVGYTHVQPSGNRVLSGAGAVTDGSPIEYDLDGTPAWLAVLPADKGSVWVVAGQDGTVRALTVRDAEIVRDTTLEALPEGTPPVVTATDEPRLLERPEGTARYSTPVPVGGGRLLVVHESGDLLLRGPEGTTRKPVDALPDTRIVRVAAGRYALLAGPTGRYGHGALGDTLEASAVVIADVRGGLSVRTPVALDEAVIEGVAPLAADVTGDGRRDIVVTLADANRGARVAAFTRAGERIATGPAFDTGFRWRHQLCVAPLGPDGERELAAVRTPHIGGVAQFHRRRGDSFEVVAGVDGVSSHALGSRNLGGGLAGDMDGDSGHELLVPTQQRDELVGIRRSTGGADVVWRLALAGELSSNLAGTTRPDGTAVVGAGTADGTLHVWSA